MRSENLARVFRQDFRRLHETLEVPTATQVIRELVVRTGRFPLLPRAYVSFTVITHTRYATHDRIIVNIRITFRRPTQKQKKNLGFSTCLQQQRKIMILNFEGNLTRRKNSQIRIFLRFLFVYIQLQIPIDKVLRKF